jgi:serine/threonine protein kinase
VDEPTVTERPGTVIGPYKLMEQIGEGGMGLVFVAEQVQPVRRKVALKVIKPGMDTRDVIARFEQERQALALMDHPNIAKVLDAGATDTGRPYFVMELVRGVPITEYCDTNQLTPKERLGLFVSVCHAVQHAHQKGVVHRDLKPSNVLVTLHDGTPVVKVIDFGVAKAVGQHLTEKTIYTRFAQMIGTPLYMSPEQAEMSGLDIDTRSDVYSLGVLLYELLTGTTPFDRQRILKAAFDEVRRIIREEDPPKPSTRLSTLGATLPAVSAKRRTEPRKLSALVKGDLDWIVMKALEKDRTRRYETANGLARDVQRYLADEPVEACPPSASYRLRKFARRYKTLLATAAAFLALLAVGTAVSTWQAVRATTAEREEREQRDAARAAQEVAEDQRRLAQGKEAAAVREADKARTLAGMMQELLGTADPDATKGGDYTVRQMVDDFEVGLGERLKDQPEVEADLRMTIGQAYRFMRLDAKAEQQFRRVLELRRRTSGPDHRTVAQSLTQLAWSLRLQYKWSDAEAQARAALAILGQLGDRGEDRAEALRTLAHTLNAQGKNPVETEAMYREALDLAERRAGGRPTALVANIAHDLARQLQMHGRAAEGLALATRSVALHRIVHGDKHPETAHGLRVVGRCHEALGQLDDAERALRESLTIFRGAYGSRPHPFALATLGTLLAVLDDQYKDEAAEAVLKACLTAWQKSDLSSVEVADAVHSQRGNACLDRGDYAAAERHFRAALDAARKTAVPLLDPMVQSFQFAVGATQYIQGKTEEGHAAVQGLVLPARMATLKADLPPSLQVAFAFALVVGGSGKPEELQAARTLAGRAVESSERTIPAARGLGVWALALALHRGGDRDRAIDELRKALALAKPFARPGETLGLLSWRELEALLVKCLVEKGDRAAAEEALRDGLKTLQANLPAGHPELAAAQVRLAAVLADQQRHADAESLLLAAHESLKAHPQAAASDFLKERRADAADRLARLYDAWGKPDEAAKWRKELEATKPTQS